jgi:hypothetical protein
MQILHNKTRMIWIVGANTVLLMIIVIGLFAKFRHPMTLDTLLWLVCFICFSGNLLLNSVVFLDPRPALEFRDDGLIATAISPDLIPWSAISQFAIRQAGMARMIEIRFVPNVARSIALSKRSYILSPINRFFGFGHFYIPTNNLELGAEDIMNHMQAHRDIRTEDAVTG